MHYQCMSAMCLCLCLHNVPPLPLSCRAARTVQVSPYEIPWCPPISPTGPKRRSAPLCLFAASISYAASLLRYAMPRPRIAEICPCVAAPSFAEAEQRSTVAMRPSRCFSIALPGGTNQIRSCALPSYSIAPPLAVLHCLCRAPHCLAMPLLLLCRSGRRDTSLCLCSASLCLCLALPVSAVPKHLVAVP